MARLAMAPVQATNLRTTLLLSSVKVTFQNIHLPPTTLSTVIKRLDHEIRIRLMDKLEKKNQDLAHHSKLFDDLQDRACWLDRFIRTGIGERILLMGGAGPLARFNQGMSWLRTPEGVPQLTGFLPNPEDMPLGEEWPDDGLYRDENGALIPLWSDGRDRTAQELVVEVFEAMGPWPPMQGALTKKKKARSVNEQLNSAASKVDHGEKKRMAAQRFNGLLAKLGHSSHKIIGFRMIAKDVIVPRWVDVKDRTALGLLRELGLLIRLRW